MFKNLTRLLLVLTIPAVIWIACNDEPDGPTSPDRLISVNGNYFKSQIGLTTSDRPMTVRLTDKSGNRYPNKWIKFELLEGDGLLDADSLQTNSSGEVTIRYSFSGQLGHSVIRASYGTLNSLDLFNRISTIIEDVGGQGDYTLFRDTYQDVLNFLGNPQGTAEDPTSWLNYAEYLDSTGVVIMVHDQDSSTTVNPIEDVLGVILTSELDPDTKDTIYAYRGKSLGGIGIGSTAAEVQAVFGIPNLKEFDPTYPPAHVYHYDPVGAVVFFDTVNTAPGDTLAMEIHVTDKGIDLNTLAKRRGTTQNASAKEYRGYHPLR